MGISTDGGKGMMVFQPKSLEVELFLFQQHKSHKTVAFINTKATTKHKSVTQLSFHIGKIY